MSFASLGLSDALVRAVNEHGYTQPTPIQMQAIPAVLAGGDLLAGAQTGTGKTAGFVLPMLQRLLRRPRRRARAAARAKPIRALILTPTRELAAQVEESVRVYGKHAKLASMVMFGGVGFGAQTAQLRRGVDILVATPGRLLDHQGQGNVDLSRVEILVLDEADRMLDMGFIRDIKRILALLPRKRQNLLFSATFSDEIKDLADHLLNAPALIEVTPRNSTVDTIRQTVHPVDRDQKRELLSQLIGRRTGSRCSCSRAPSTARTSWPSSSTTTASRAVAIHGNKSQGARTRALAEFKDGELQVLVATDIAARGIDIDELPHVVNYDLPNVPQDYVHRIGRTGRAGAAARRSRWSASTSMRSCATSSGSSSGRCREPSSPVSSRIRARSPADPATARPRPATRPCATRRDAEQAARGHAACPRSCACWHGSPTARRRRNGAATKRRTRCCTGRTGHAKPWAGSGRDARETPGHPPLRRTRPLVRAGLPHLRCPSCPV